MGQLNAKRPGSLVLAAGVLGRVAWGANERVRVGVMGVNGRGWNHVTTIHGCPQAELAAICDPDAQRLEGRSGEAGQLTGQKPTAYADVREMLADASIDAITIAAPNHWHTPAALWALKAGKHAYVEKPICHTIEEGARLVQAAKESGLVVQHGTQRRSDPHWQKVVEAAHNGIIGDIYMVRCICFQPRPAVAFPLAEDPPPYLDWNLWQGPAMEQPFSRNFVHYNWHWFWRYGNGEVGNNIVHFTDIAHWIMGKGLPVEVYSEGGRFGYDDAAETPNTQVMTNRFADGTIVVNEVRNRFSHGEAGVNVGLLMYGAEGHMADGVFYNKRGVSVRTFEAPKPADGTQAHMDKFIGAISENNPESVAGSAEDGFTAAALCHLGNISYRVGRSLKFDPEQMQFTQAPEEANALLRSTRREGFEV